MVPSALAGAGHHLSVHSWGRTLNYWGLETNVELTVINCLKHWAMGSIHGAGQKASSFSGGQPVGHVFNQLPFTTQLP